MSVDATFSDAIVGLVNLPALVEPLRSAGYTVVTGADLKEASAEFDRASARFGGAFPLIVRIDRSPGLRAWLARRVSTLGVSAAGVGTDDPELMAAFSDAKHFGSTPLLAEVLSGVGVSTAGLSRAGLADARIEGDSGRVFFEVEESHGPDWGGDEDPNGWALEAADSGPVAVEAVEAPADAPAQVAVEGPPLVDEAPTAVRPMAATSAGLTSASGPTSTPTPAESVQLVQPVQPVRPVQPVPPVHPVTPAQPVQVQRPEPLRPAAPAQPPVQPPAPAQFPAQPVQHATPVSPSAHTAAPFDDFGFGGGTGYGRGGHVIVVAGAKGGIGKSTLATSLAQHAGRAGLRVILIDANFGQSDQTTVLRLPPTVPSIYHAVVNGGDITAALLSPERIGQERGDLNSPDRVRFALLAGPFEKHANPAIVTPAAYLSAVDQARRIADLVVIDTQIVEADRTAPMVTDFMVPLLQAGAWCLALSDESKSGLVNLIGMLTQFAGRNITADRVLVMLNKLPPRHQVNMRAIEEKANRFGTFLGAAGMDLAVHRFQNEGRLVDNLSTLSVLLDAALHRVTGRDDFTPRPGLNTATPDQAAAPTRKPRWWRRGARR